MCSRSRGRLTLHFSSHFLTSPRQTRPTVLTYQAIPSTRFRFCLFLFPLPPHSRFYTHFTHAHTTTSSPSVSSSTARHRLHSFRRRLDLIGLHILRTYNSPRLLLTQQDNSTTLLQPRFILVELPISDCGRKQTGCCPRSSSPLSVSSVPLSPPEFSLRSLVSSPRLAPRPTTLC